METLEDVSGYRRQEVAGRAGVDLAYVARLVELGILTPDAQDRLGGGDVRREALSRRVAAGGGHPRRR